MFQMIAFLLYSIFSFKWQLHLQNAIYFFYFFDKVRRNQFTERKKSKANRNLLLEKDTSVFKNKFHKLDESLSAAFQLGLVYFPGFLSSTKISLKSWLPSRESYFKGVKQADEYHSVNSSAGDQKKSHCFRCYCQSGPRH